MAEFYGHGGVCIASCFNQKCTEMRAAVDLRGHSSCVTFTPGDEKFALNYGCFIERHAKSAGRVFVIVGDVGEEGQWQQKEMELLRDHNIPFEKLTLMEYQARYPVAASSSKTLADGTVEQGCFHEQTGALQAGRRRRPNGVVEEGAFDGAQAGLLQQGKGTLAYGTEEVGTFVAHTGEAQLKRGSRRSPDGYLQEGNFFTGTGRNKFRQGKFSFDNGDVFDVEFVDDSGVHSRGVRHKADGTVEEGKFVLLILREGRRRHPDDREEWVGGPKNAAALQGLFNSVPLQSVTCP